MWCAEQNDCASRESAMHFMDSQTVERGRDERNAVTPSRIANNGHRILLRR
jgi:hypothetical protein